MMEEKDDKAINASGGASVSSEYAETLYSDYYDVATKPNLVFKPSHPTITASQSDERNSGNSSSTSSSSSNGDDDISDCISASADFLAKSEAVSRPTQNSMEDMMSQIEQQKTDMPNVEQALFGTTTATDRSPNELGDSIDFVDAEQPQITRQQEYHDVLEMSYQEKKANTQQQVVATPKRSGANQEYYDVLELASNRLQQQDNEPQLLNLGPTTAAYQTRPLPPSSPPPSPPTSTRHSIDSTRYSINSQGGYLDDNDSSGDEAVRKRKKKKKHSKKNHKKDKRRSKSSSPKHDDDDVSGIRRSAVFKQLYPPGMMEHHIRGERHRPSFSKKDLDMQIGKNKGNQQQYEEDDYNFDPNEDLPTTTGTTTPSLWNPAALVTAAQSKLSDSKIDKHGFYDNMKSTVQSMVQPKNKPDEMPNNFNLQSIANQPPIKEKKQKKSKYKTLTRCDSIDWGDGSVMSGVLSQSNADREAGNDTSSYNGKHPYHEPYHDNPNEGVEMTNTRVIDDCSYDELDEATKQYLVNQGLVQKMMWHRDRRRLGIVLCIAIIFFSICLGFYLAEPKIGGDGNAQQTPSTLPIEGKEDVIGRKEPPPRPLPQKPMTPVISEDGSGLHKMTLNDLQYIVNTITSDADVLKNPHSPQSKALAWAQNDMKVYNVEVGIRVAQRYALATLYYATNGTGWTTRTSWGSGPECEWYGVECDVGESNVASVTYLDLNSNHLEGTIPLELGYLQSLEQCECLTGQTWCRCCRCATCFLCISLEYVQLPFAHTRRFYYHLVHLWGNDIVGSIPSTLSQLSKLHTLYLDDCHLDGEIGDTLNQLKNLKHLDLSGNKLRGHIPHGLGSLGQLRDLRLSNNLLTSTFPMSLISLSNLQTLLLDSNAISGTLPSLLGEMRQLVTLRIQENDLKGPLPSFVDVDVLEEAQ